ncbi:glycosyltransferase family 2 protein [Flammeovirga sp. SubArs3]|uniref:glycosyltransferase n=1 Tax=Flammeovirga sp. SubArs3 TaxID=2995316 RepID=UPI00248AB30A|nr:glycosyltransferase family 2 protein [Flammeovirga sp. SubArs3]
MNPKVTLIVPTYNAGNLWESWIKNLEEQEFILDKILIVDSSSKDKTIEKAKNSKLKNLEIKVISPLEFDHGGTRNSAARDNKDSDIIIFITQDAILSSKDSLEKIVRNFKDENVSGVYGRQLPHIDATPIAKHARLFNYPDLRVTKDKTLIDKIGFKVCFMSNSYSAFRTRDFIEFGGFPEKNILSEETLLASKLILGGKKIIYENEAKVNHSHNYSFSEEFKRYFDTGVFHAKNQWIINSFGSPNGEGFKFIVSELKFLLKNKNYKWIIKSFIYTIMKLFGFKLGQKYKLLPKRMVVLCSMHKNYWNE